MSNENSQHSNSASSALKSRLCYVIQVVAFIVAILGLVLFLTIDYIGNTGNNNIQIINRSFQNYNIYDFYFK